jgi:type I restriction enzyme M protein
MLDTPTKKRIDDCRDILVGKLPDPKAQIEQITIGLIYKFMDDMDKEAIELGGKAKFFADYTVPDPENPKQKKLIPFSQYSWDNLFNTKVTAAEMLRLYSEAIAGMDKNPNIPQLFRDIFKNAFLPYRDPETLKLFLKTIGEFEYTHSEKLGDAFEYLLSVMGSQGDAGQFRTPRHIIDFLVAVVNPGKKDTILDPACGTAGFLISAFKHIKEQNKKGLTPEERKKLIQNFTGYDISPDMVRLSLVNLYLHGFNDPHIWEYDALSSEERWDETADVILANPPFMSPKGGIRPHKKFSISSNRSEVLFVDYIAEHLNPKGRAGIIVPEGVIFQSGTAYKELRKMLVENYLYAVVSLPAGVFNPYSGVKTSILLMDKEFAKKSNKILFVKIENDGYGLGAQRTPVKGSQLKEAIEILQQFKDGVFTESELAHAVVKSEISKNSDYNLSRERYLRPMEANSAFELVPLGELAKLITKGTTPTSIGYSFQDTGINFIKIESITEHGTFLNEKFNYISKECHDKLSRSQLKENDVLFSIAGAFGRSAVVTKEILPANTNQALAIIRPGERLLPKYLRSVLKSDHILDIVETLKVGVAQYNLSLKQINELEIPLPPLSIQKEIVAEIEGWQKIIDGAKAVVENYKPKIDINPNWELGELGELCDVRDGTHDSPKYVLEGGIPFITQKNITKEGLSFDDVNYISEEDHLKIIKRSNVEYGDIIFSMIGANRGMTCLIDDKRVFSIKNVGLIKPIGKINQKYLLTYLQSADALNHVALMSTGGAQSFISLKTLRTFPIPVPDKETQHQIVSQIEKEQTLVNANKQLIEIFEQKIKERIAKVWGEEKGKAKVYEANEELSMVADQ